GMYNNQLEFEVTDSRIQLGVRNENYTSSNWAIFDNFKLEYFGTDTHASSISFPQKTLTLELGTSHQLTLTYVPENTVYRKVNWRSSNPAIASVDEWGNLTTHSKGTVTIIAISADNSSVSATCSVTVTQNDATSESLVINEIMAANVDMFMDPSWNYGGFVELYNPSTEDAAIGKFYVSDDPANLKKCVLPSTMGKIPAKGFRTLWFDHSDRHTPTQVNMKLDTDGGTIYISNCEGNIVAQQSYPPSMARISYARTTDGGSQWNTTADPTPSATNATSKFASIRLAAPSVDKDAQLFTGNLSVSVGIPTGTTLRYTTDGTTPTMENGMTSTTGKFNISNTTVFRFRLFQNGKLPSPVVTRSYLYNSGNYELPIISIVTDEDNVYSDEFGIFVQGSGNGLVGNGQSAKCNWNTDWERPAHFEYITTDNECILSQEADISSCGGWSRAFTPHSFKIKSGKKFDEHLNYFPFQPFEEKQYLRHKVLQIRNGGNDTQARFIDPAIQEIIQRSG
ncbi:MAG: Ig-like domain-containing protein, partial [Bacteroidaceae bacterium]|nr:Ig-like domain-containing protein [Bacteroidaceae bacterium]